MPRNHRFFTIPCVVAIAMCGVSCGGDDEEIVITETRRLTTRDTAPLIDATSDQRFRNAQPSPVIGEPPENWLVMPSSQFRDLNYRFGESGFGEVYVTIAAGGELDNVNRWFDQFQAPRVNADGLAEMRRVPIAGTTGVWIEATGTYSGMGRETREGFGLAGVIAETRGATLTVKMVGPAAEVREQHEALEAFAASLRFRQ